MSPFSRFVKTTLCFSDRWIAGAIFLLTAALYLRTAGPTLGGAFDSEEFQYVAPSLGIAHSTGYPLYLLLGYLASLLLPLGNAAFRMNLLSVLLGAGGPALVFLGALQLTRRRGASLAAAAFFATNAAVWRQSGVASVGPLHLLLSAAIVYALVRWYAEPPSREMGLGVVALLFGLGLAHHRSILLLAPGATILVFATGRDLLQRPRVLVRTVLLFMLPLLLYLYIPLRGGFTPWYNNTWQGFVAEISGGDASGYLRANLSDLFQGIESVAQYLLHSFGYVGIGLVILGVTSVWPRRNRWTTRLSDRYVILFLGLSTLAFSIWGVIYAGEPDRYFVLPFFFLAYWFAIGVGSVEVWISSHIRAPFARRGSEICLGAILLLMFALPFEEEYRIANWSSYDRVYRQWDEIFSLPLPRGSVLVGNWPQLNAMRYMQRIENRRPDLEFVGTLYDTEPQTRAAHSVLPNGRALFLAPGIPLPSGFRYQLLGSLVQVLDEPQGHNPVTESGHSEVSLSPLLALADWQVFKALEPFRPSDPVSIGPGRTVRVALVWRAVEKLDDFVVRLALYDPEARLVAQIEEPPVRGLYSPSQWNPGEYVSDVHNLLIPSGSPPGRYSLRLIVLDPKSRVSIGDRVDLAGVNVERATGLERDSVFVQHVAQINLNPSLSILGYGGLDGTHPASDRITLNLLWSVREPTKSNIALRLALFSPDGTIVAEWTRTPIGYYPSDLWQRGELLKAYYDVQLPDDLPGGRYSLAVAVAAGNEAAPLFPLSQVQVIR